MKYDVGSVIDGRVIMSTDRNGVVTRNAYAFLDDIVRQNREHRAEFEQHTMIKIDKSNPLLKSALAGRLSDDFEISLALADVIVENWSKI